MSDKSESSQPYLLTDNFVTRRRSIDDVMCRRSIDDVMCRRSIDDVICRRSIDDAIVVIDQSMTSLAGRKHSL